MTLGDRARGMQFGLQTSGRGGSIFISLPPHVRWDYDIRESRGPAADPSLEVPREPREWVEPDDRRP